MTQPPAEVRLEAHAAKQFSRAPRPVQQDLRRKAKQLAHDPQRGTFIGIRRVPKTTLAKWDARVGVQLNLYKLDLSGGWRALYAVGSDGPLRVVVILEVVDHKEYDRLLGYG